MKKIYRSVSQRKVCGVCAGIAEFLGIDPTIIRVVWIALSIFNIFLSLVFYFLLVLVIPRDEGYIDTSFREKKD
ncbi:MAG: PspC domain-containing protein [Firmicutes bacterium]|nr:PspC domain-containing protein [Bacillota bacterium]